MTSYSLDVAVENLAENQIVEITYDGQEIIQPPLTQSEHFTKMANKIDFQTVIEDGYNDGDVEADDRGASGDQSEDITQEASGKWPWEGVRNKLVEALTELTVLSDVISIATKECGKDAQGHPKRYMFLDGPVQHEHHESKQFLSLIAKKKSLEAPARILLAGAEHLRTLKSETSSSDSSNPDFHMELLKLRQNWRLKKVGNTILGDLSYRTAGSQYKQCTGVFEVSKSDEGDHDEDAPFVNRDIKLENPRKSTLRVTVPPVLEGIAYIQVVVNSTKDNEKYFSSNFTLTGSTAAPPEDTHWQKKLEAAQNVLFCRELFAQLAKEAIQLQSPIPHLVVGNQIIASIFRDMKLVITLCQSGEDKSGEANGHSDSGHQAYPREHNHVLEHSLHQLLRQAHERNMNKDHGGLSTASVCVSKRRRLAGPHAADRKSLVQLANQETILEQIIKQSQHCILRLHTMFLLDSMAKELRDPLITCHWAPLNSPTRSSVKVNIMTHGYELIIRTQLMIQISEKNLKVISKDGKVVTISHEPQELRDFLLSQISLHQMNGVQSLARCTGWQVLLSSINQLGCGPVEPLGSATACLLVNSTGDRFIAVRHNTSLHASVYVASAPLKDFFAGAIVKDKKWENLPESFQELRLDKLEGKCLLYKVEILMAALSSLGSS